MICAPRLRALYICLHKKRPPSRGAPFRAHCPLDKLKPFVVYARQPLPSKQLSHIPSHLGVPQVRNLHVFHET